MNNGNYLFTIGFTQKTAEIFFNLLGTNNVRRLIDTRLNNTGQLAGFSKRDDLQYFCRKILSIEYVHWTESAPEASILKAYKEKNLSWSDYTYEYSSMLQRRKVETQLHLIENGNACLLCSEAKPHNCHRSILAEYLSKKSGTKYTVKHLL